MGTRILWKINNQQGINMKHGIIALIVIALAFSSTVDAKGGMSSGGSVSRGGFSSAPSRPNSPPPAAPPRPSTPPPAVAPRPPTQSPAAAPQRQTTTTTTTSSTTVNRSYGGRYVSQGGNYGGMGMGYGYSNGLLTGLIIGNMMHPHGTVVYGGPGMYANNAVLYPNGSVVNQQGVLVGTYQNGNFVPIQNGAVVAQPVPSDAVQQQAPQQVVIANSGYSGWEIFGMVMLGALIVALVIGIVILL